ncbi:MAG: ABC transporter permease [Planctomycetota bacterium]|jgi:lipoprotein-releasing system permease protein
MYHALLTNRYLTSRVIPLIAVAAVALCVALVIIVVSVMTGFLNMVRESGRTLMGDVIVSYPISGIPHFERLIERIEAMPEAAAATPVVDSWGLLRMPYPQGAEKETAVVQIWGIEPESFNDVTGYGDTLYWRPFEESAIPRMRPDDIRQEIGNSMLADRFESGRTLTNPDSQLPAIVMGIHVSIGNQRQSDGTYEPALNGYWWMPRFDVVLTALPVYRGGFQDPVSEPLQIVNEFMSGVFLIDEKRVLVPLALAQRMLHLDEAERFDPDDPDVITGKDPSRSTMVLVRTADGVSPDELRDAVMVAYDQFVRDLYADDDEPVKPPPLGFTVSIQTWEQQQAKFIAPVEKERELMRTLFSLVYLVCAGLVLSIFWAIVYEKTRDIGILRSIGASRWGISWIFLRYGLVIGILGAILGLGLGSLVIRYINSIHSAMANPPLGLAIGVYAAAAVSLVLTVFRSLSGRLLPLVLGALVTLTLLVIGSVVLLVKYVVGGFVIWDPAVYYFTEIPSRMDWDSAVITMIGAVVFSLLGAFLPAAKAADTDPVRALRYE